MSHRDSTDDNDSQYKPNYRIPPPRERAQHYIRYYEGHISRQSHEEGKTYYGVGLAAAQRWFRLIEMDNPPDTEIDDLIAHLEQHLRDYGTGWTDMYMGVHAWKRILGKGR